MRKIPSLFKRDLVNRGRITREVNDNCEWVIAGEGMATRKWDGTACMIRDGKLYKRYNCRKERKPPFNFEPCQEPDPITGHWPGWIPVGDGPEDKWHREAFHNGCSYQLTNGTYELIGPKTNGNPEKITDHLLIKHGCDRLIINDLSFNGIRDYLAQTTIEGIVWHHPDGRMCKIKTRDFGIPWPRR